MAAAIGRSFVPAATLVTGLPISRIFVCVWKPFLPTISAHRSWPTLRASSTAIVETSTEAPIIADEEVGACNKSVLACPICYSLLTLNGGSALTVESAAGSSLLCNTCKKTYFCNETHIDLTLASGAKDYDEAMPASTEVFRTRLVSFLYERGWRQNFVWGGFPGPEKEFEMAQKYLKPVLGGKVIDASCGSGLFSRFFAKSGLFSLVVALDFSENMLQQCYNFVIQDKSFPKENLIMVRADISRLPFASSSVSAVHAGAALHCWPSPSTAVAEISRVLHPGGIFVATTYILDGAFSLIPFLGTARERLKSISGSQIFLYESELEDLCKACGLVGFTCVRNGLFVMISATKPS